MPHFLVAGYIPDDFDPSQMDEAAGREIHALNKEMIAAGVRVYACGLGRAKSLRPKPDGGVVITDGMLRRKPVAASMLPRSCQRARSSR